MSPASRCVLSLVIPAHDEVLSIGEAVDGAHEALEAAGIDHEVIVVDDGSTDGTAATVEALAVERPWLRSIRLPGHRGKGAALREGFAVARMDRLAFIDADLDVPPEEIPRVFLLASAGTIVVGSRMRRVSGARLFVSVAYRTLVRVVLGVSVRDVGCPLKIFPRSLLDGPTLVADGWVVDAELLARAVRAGLTITQVPVASRGRRLGKSSFGWSAIASSLVGLFAVRRALRAKRG